MFKPVITAVRLIWKPVIIALSLLVKYNCKFQTKSYEKIKKRISFHIVLIIISYEMLPSGTVMWSKTNLSQSPLGFFKADAANKNVSVSLKKNTRYE